MKKLILVLMLAFLVQFMTAQTSNPMYFGARAGMNLGNVSLSPENYFGSGVSKSMRTGLVAGAYGEFGIVQDFAITVEALYLQGGFKLSAGGGEATLKVDEFVIPVSGKYKFAIENSAMKPFIFAGGDIGFTAKSEVESGGQTQDQKDSTESMDIGIHFGVGVEYEVSPGVNLFIDGRYAIGLKDMAKPTDVEMKPTNIAIMAGVSFKIN
jgi:opacity protein-like surface antigen